MNFIIILLLVFVSCDYSETSNQFFKKSSILSTNNNMTCLTTVDLDYYTCDISVDDKKNYEPFKDPHLICCNEPFSSDTIIPSLYTDKSSLEIINMDFKVLTNGKTNCSIYYGHWLFSIVPFKIDMPQLTIHPLTVRVLLG